MTYKSVKGILDRGLDQEELKRPLQIAIPSHENIRGGQYYRAGAGSEAP